MIVCLVSLATSHFSSHDANTRQGPAIHMSNLIPTSASLLTPSSTLVQDILYRADLSQPILELAVVILDSLTPRFTTTYRRQLPLSSDQQGQQHIDDVRPELIVASSLLIANKYFDDNEMPTSRWATKVGAGLWSCQQLNTTERLVLDCIGWNIMDLSDDWLLAEARDDMDRAGVNARRRAKRMDKKKPTLHRKDASIDLKEDYQMQQADDGFQIQEGGNGRSVQFMGQWTPVESPSSKERLLAQ